MKSVPIAIAALAMLCLGSSHSAAQSADDLAKQTQNPIATLISVPFQGNWDFGLGDRDATGTLFNFQPVVPFPVSAGTNATISTACAAWTHLHPRLLRRRHQAWLGLTDDAWSRSPGR